MPGPVGPTGPAGPAGPAGSAGTPGANGQNGVGIAPAGPATALECPAGGLAFQAVDGAGAPVAGSRLVVCNGLNGQGGGGALSYAFASGTSADPLASNAATITVAGTYLVHGKAILTGPGNFTFACKLLANRGIASTTLEAVTVKIGTILFNFADTGEERTLAFSAAAPLAVGDTVLLRCGSDIPTAGSSLVAAAVDAVRVAP